MGAGAGGGGDAQGWPPPAPPLPPPPRKRRRGCGLAVLIAVVFVVVLTAVVATIGRLAQNQREAQSPGPTSPAPIGPGGTEPAAPGGRSTVERWMENASPAAWDGVSNRIFFNRRDDDGIWGGFSAMPDGTGVRCVTCAMASPTGVEPGKQRGLSDVTPDGRYLVATIEKADHPPPVGSAFSSPGRGLYSDLWLIRTDGSEAWPLTDLSLDPVSGAIWPRFDRTGTQVVWAQMHQGFDPGHPLGYWTMHVAKIEWRGGVPTLRDQRVYDPQPNAGRFFEPYQFSPDNKRIIFASDLDTPSVLLGPSQTNTQIWTIDAATLGDVRRVSPDAPITMMFSNYNEFAYYLPDTNGSRVMFARTSEATAHGMDIWTANADGGDVRRLTFLNEPNDPQYLGYAVAGGLAFDPKNPKRFVVGVSQHLNGETINAYFITLP